eukprot:TRINITY_DN8944_c0_g1_i2.p2 TRINITY_DN8944_c0_g1~~TRINITY_DN8944_c0_g1_i2.p2  ORF type:complete len:128 (-),score=34.20 TRINITY_DN8944_c0_g1_i2:157-510(-)
MGQELALEQRFRQISDMLYAKLFPLWHAVINGQKTARWDTAQSSDMLTFFVYWLLINAPQDKAEWFMNTVDAGILENEFFNNALYLDEDGFLVNNGNSIRRETLSLVRARFPERFNV